MRLYLQSLPEVWGQGSVDNHSTRAVAYLPSAWATDVCVRLTKHTVSKSERRAFDCSESRSQLILEWTYMLSKHLLHAMLHRLDHRIDMFERVSAVVRLKPEIYGKGRLKSTSAKSIVEAFYYLSR